MNKQIEPTADLFKEYINQSKLIESMLAEIDHDTRFQSNPQYILDHPCFADLVSMGDRIVCFLHHHMLHSGFSWIGLLLLHKITGANPVPPESQGHFSQSVAYWLMWYNTSKYADMDDIYQNLVDIT